MPKIGKIALWAVLVWVQMVPMSAMALEPVMAQDFTLDAYQGKVVLMDFWASWCTPCEQSMPWLAQMQADHELAGLQVVAVNLDKDWASADKMALTLPSNVILVHDPDGILAAQRNLQGMPSAYVYDRQGQLVMAHVGFQTSDSNIREAEIVALLTGESGNFNLAALGDDVSGVQPWQRDLLAAPGMEIDPDPIETALDEHIYFSKEASSGGLGSGGGGCGCN